MKNIHVLRTDQSSRLFEFMTKLFLLDKIDTNEGNMNRHICITSDEEIKDGDYVLSDISIGPLYLDGKINTVSMLAEGQWKKIILTTDQELIKNGVQAIDDEFLEWFVKNPSCDEVDIKKIYLSNNGEWKDVLLPSEWEVDTKIGYKIIISKEEAKQETLEEAAEKDYQKQTSYDKSYSRKDGFKAGAKWQADG